MGEAISSLLFQPPTATYLHPSRHFWLTTSSGSSIPAFFIERPNAQVTILFSHGNAEDLGMIYDWVRQSEPTTGHGWPFVCRCHYSLTFLLTRCPLVDNDYYCSLLFFFSLVI
jgi:hypothetical protein